MKDTTKAKVKAITEQLEQGVQDLFHSDTFAAYLQTMARFHSYSARNCLLIAMQCPKASRVAGYKTWQACNRQVRKGEKAISILAPIKRKFTAKKEIEGETIEEEVEYMAYMPVSVFDVSQTDGDDLPDIVQELTGDVDGDLIDRITALSPVPVAYEEIGGDVKGYYSHTENRIAIKKDMSGEQTAKTLVHEIAHAILHNKTDGAEKDADKSTREVQAESTAYTVLNWLGIDTSDYSFGYVAGWSSGKDTKELQASLEIIRKTAADMIEQLAA